MLEQEKDIVKWYLVGTKSVHHEMKIRDSLRKEGFSCYVPLVYDIKKVRGVQKRMLRPAITGLIFAKLSYNDFKTYLEQKASDILFLRKSSYSNREEYLTVSDKDMERFIALTEAFIDKVEYFTPDELTVREGEMVKIMLGSREYEAEVKRVKGKKGKHLVVEIANVAAVIELKPELMRRITRLSDPRSDEQRKQREVARQKKLLESGKADLQKSKNLEMDKKQLFDIAFRLLFQVADNHREDVENRVAKAELRHLMTRLEGMKGVLPAIEAELALSMFLAATCLNENAEEAAERLRRALAKIKDSSILHLRVRFYLSLLTHDTPELQSVLNTAKSWNKLRLSPRQQAFLSELRCTSVD